MTTILQEVAKEKGYEIIAPDPITNSVLQHFWMSVAGKVKAGINKGKPMRLQLGLTSSPICGAWSGTKSGVDFIALNNGTFFILWGAFRAILSHNQFLPEYKRREVDQDPFKIHIFQSRNETLDQLRSLRMLKDAAREEIACYLATYALFGILHHEFTHIYNGHIDLTNDPRARAILKPISYQTLEWDADQISIDNMLCGMLHPRVTMDGTKSCWDLPEKSNIFGSIEMAIVCASLAVQVGHLIMMPFEQRFEIDEKYHPPSSYRLHASLGQMANILGYRTSWSDEQFMPFISRGIETALLGWKEVAGMDHIKVGLDTAKLRDELFHAYQDEWERLHPELDARKRGVAIAPPRPVH